MSKHIGILTAGGDVILIPEIPYDLKSVANAIINRQQRGTNFSIVAVAEGVLDVEGYKTLKDLKNRKNKAKEKGDTKALNKANEALVEFARHRKNNTLRLTEGLEGMTGLESRLTILGHYQRGGTPSAADRLLATSLGSACIEYILDDRFGGMIAVRGSGTEFVPLKEVVGVKKMVSVDHPWIRAARNVGTCLGD